jgi:hypothetical protein
MSGLRTLNRCMDFRRTHGESSSDLCEGRTLRPVSTELEDNYDVLGFERHADIIAFAIREWRMANEVGYAETT